MPGLQNSSRVSHLLRSQLRGAYYANSQPLCSSAIHSAVNPRQQYTTTPLTRYDPHLVSRSTLVSSLSRKYAIVASMVANPAANDGVDVTRDNFEETLPSIKEALDECEFFAFDCEMTGLFLDGYKHEYLDDMQDRYTKLAASSGAFVINQFGLSAFKRVGDNSYEARTFNFYIFPQPHGSYSRKFTCDAGSLAFLASQGFDFNKCIYHGVPFMPLRTRDYMRMQAERSGNEPRGPEPLNLAAEDQRFVSELHATVTAWLGATEEPQLVLPAVNSFLRMLQYRELAKPQFGNPEHPGFYITRLEGGGSSPNLVLVRATAQEAAQREQEQRAARVAEVQRAAGFSRVMELLAQCGKPGVGHNPLFDVSYVLAQFVDQQLPLSWQDFRALAARWFRGGLFDTKYLARSLPEVFGCETSLGEVYKALAKGEKAEELRAALGLPSGAPLPLPAIRHAPGSSKYEQVEAGGLAHEAGYDAFMTGAAFACLAQVYTARAGLAGSSAAAAEGTTELGAAEAAAALSPGLAHVAPYLGRINVTRSDIPYAAFTGPDPEPPRPNIFHVYGLAPMTRVGDIVKAFGARGLGRVRVTFVNSTSAFVETDVEVAGGVMQAAEGLSLAKVVPYSEYARCKRMGVPLPGLDVQVDGSDEDEEAGRGRKRSRREQEEGEEEGVAKKGSCAIM